MMKFGTFCKEALLPTPHNVYRPRLLGKEGLALFLAIIVVAEGFYVSSAFGVNPSQFILASVGVADGPHISLTVLAAAAAILATLLILTVVVHPRIQPTDLVLSGGTILVIALFLLWSTIAFLPEPSGENALAAPGPAQYHW